MKITRQRLRRMIVEELSESSYHQAEYDWAQESATLITNILVKGIESVLDIELSQEDADEYATDIMGALQQHGSEQLLKSINDIYREAEGTGPYYEEELEPRDEEADAEDELSYAAGRPWEHN